MRLFAKNNYLIVEIEEQKVEENPLSAFINSSTTNSKSHNVAKIIDAVWDSKFHNDIGSKVLFQSHLLEIFNIDGQVYHIIPESAVYGVFRKEKYAPNDD